MKSLQYKWPPRPLTCFSDYTPSFSDVGSPWNNDMQRHLPMFIIEDSWEGALSHTGWDSCTPAPFVTCLVPPLPRVLRMCLDRPETNEEHFSLNHLRHSLSSTPPAESPCPNLQPPQPTLRVPTPTFYLLFPSHTHFLK